MDSNQISLCKPSDLGDATPVLNLYSNFLWGEISISDTDLKAIEAILGYQVNPDTGELFQYGDAVVAELTKTVNRKVKRLKNLLKK